MNVAVVANFVYTGGNTAYIYTDEKLFFIFPVKVKQEVILGESGVIVEVNQSFLSKLLGLLSA